MILYALLAICAVQLMVSPVDSEYVTCQKGWTSKGCKVDYFRDLKDNLMIDDRHTARIDWNNLAGYDLDLLCRCRAAAKSADIERTWFGIMKTGICYIGNPGESLAAFIARNHTLDSKTDCTGKMKFKNTIISTIDGEQCNGGEHRVYFYEVTDVAAAAPAAAPEEEVEEEKECVKKSDVVVIVDVSGSVGWEHFNMTKEFLVNFIRRYAPSIASGGSRIGIVTYDGICYVQLTWEDNAGKSVTDLEKIVNSMPYGGGSTVTDRALNCTRDTIVVPMTRGGVSKTCIVMTDGKSYRGASRIPPASKSLAAVCRVIGIGVGAETDEAELDLITGDRSQHFKLNNFSDLLDRAANFLNRLIEKSCV